MHQPVFADPKLADARQQSRCGSWSPRRGRFRFLTTEHRTE